MKLTPEHIAALNKFIESVETQSSSIEAARLRCHPSCVHGTLAVLRRLGIPVTKQSEKATQKVSASEYESFVAWKNSLPRAAE